MKNYILVTCLSLIAFQQAFAQIKMFELDTNQLPPKQQILVVTSFRDSFGFSRTYFQGLFVRSKKSGGKLHHEEHKIDDLVVVSKDTIYVESTKNRIIEYHIQFLLPSDLRLEDVDLIPKMEFHKPGGAQSFVPYSCAAIKTSSRTITFKSNKYHECYYLVLDSRTHLKGNGYYEKLLSDYVKSNVVPLNNLSGISPSMISQCDTVIVVGERRMVVLYTVKDGPMLSTDFTTFGPAIKPVVQLNFN
jgi:hypothetical protein